MIYVLEDEQTIQEMIIYALNNKGYQAQGFERPSDFYQALKKQKPTLIILDVMLPEEDGFIVLERIRKNPKYAHLPIIMLTAKSHEFDKVKGLNLGADDYITKPFSVLEFTARVQALLRRIPNQEEIRFNDLILKPEQHKVFLKDQEIDLTLKEFQVLETLLKAKNHVLTRDQLLTQVWGYEFDGENRTVDVHIRSLRKKLGKDIVQTIHGVGYMIGDQNERNNF